MTRRRLFLTTGGAALGSLLGGCQGSNERLKIILARKDGQTRLVIKELTLTFEGVVSSGRNAPDMGNFEIQVIGTTGENTDWTQVSAVEGIIIQHRLVNGMAELQAAGQTFQFIDKGRKVQFKDNAYDIGRRQIIYVAPDGSTRLGHV